MFPGINARVNIVLSRIDSCVLIPTEEWEKTKSGRKDATRNRTPGGTRVNKPQSLVLSFVVQPFVVLPDLSYTRSGPVSTSSTASVLHTPLTRCFPVRASHRFARGRVTRVPPANNLKLNLTGLSRRLLPPRTLSPDPEYRVLVLPSEPFRCPLALLRLLRHVIEGGCVSDFAGSVTLPRTCLMATWNRELFHWQNEGVQRKKDRARESRIRLFNQDSGLRMVTNIFMLWNCQSREIFKSQWLFLTYSRVT